MSYMKNSWLLVKLSRLNFESFLNGNLNYRISKFIGSVDKLYLFKRLSNSKPWLTNGLMQSIKIKSDLFKKSKRGGVSTDYYRKLGTTEIDWLI